MNTLQSSSSRAAWSSPGQVHSITISITEVFTSLLGPRQKQEKNCSLKETALEKDKSKGIISQVIHFWHHRERVPSKKYKTRKNIKLDPTPAAGLVSAEGR